MERNENEGVLLNIKSQRGKAGGRKMLGNKIFEVFSLVPWCDCWSARRALMVTLRFNVDAREPRDSQRGRRPPINDAAPLSSFHTKMAGLRKKQKKQVSEYSHLGLFIQDWILNYLKHYTRQNLWLLNTRNNNVQWGSAIFHRIWHLFCVTWLFECFEQNPKIHSPPVYWELHTKNWNDLHDLITTEGKMCFVLQRDSKNNISKQILTGHVKPSVMLPA